MNPGKKIIFFCARLIFAISLSIFLFSAKGQMRNIYSQPANTNSEIKKLSFYIASQGYIASTSNAGSWIGYTSDSGRTFTKKFITYGNINSGLYPISLFGFEIRGVKAISQNKVFVYGDFGYEPSILYSTDGGNSFNLVYWTGFTGSQTNGITDLIFPENNTVGYAIDDNRIIKTNDQGASWSVIASFPGYLFSNLEAVDNNNVFVLSTGDTNNGLLKTTNGGASWQTVSLPLPVHKMMYANFLTASTGWIDLSDQQYGDYYGKFYFYKTTDGGNSWIQVNNEAVNSFYCYKMKFTDVNTGYALSANYLVYKTVNGGINWELLPRDNSVNPGHIDLQCLSSTQLWAGGTNDFLEISTNGGGVPFPKSSFIADTSGLSVTGNVTLHNYSRTDYTYQWLLNGALISTAYNTSYTHDLNRVSDTITLIVSNGVTADSSVKYVDFFPRVRVTSFAPVSGGAGTVITITGTNFLNANTVSFGGTNAANFTVVSATIITATVSSGASGYVKVVTATGKDSLAGFIFIPPPVISSFTPVSSIAGTTVTITGNNFTNATAVAFDGITASSFTVVSSTTITAVTPSGGSGLITVSTPGGANSLNGYIALPTITSFTPLRGTQGAVLNITGTSFTGATTVSVGGINVLSFTVNSSNSVTASVGSGATGNVTVSKTGGSSSLPGYTWFTSPVVTSFSPAAGPVGTTVVITGSGFNTIAANNIVYFGAVKATVIAASATSLTVTVPVSATFQPISVVNTNTNLAGYSAKPFLVTYTGGNISGYTFGTRTTMHPSNMPMYVSLGDIDADGKPDLIVSAITPAGDDGQLLLYRNTSTTGNAVFENPINIDHVGFRGAIAADFDGDGKPDLAILSSDPVEIFLNTSTPGNISFATGPVLPGGGGYNQNSMAIADADGDGKPDIVTSEGLLYRNTSTAGNISFDKPVTVFSVSRNVLLTDLNGDDKPDLVFSDVDGGFYVLKNISTKGALAFDTPLNFTGFSHTFMIAADMDNDGKTDLVSADYYNFKLGIIRNTGSGGNFSFDAAVEMPAQNSPFGITVSDIDGDGKPDIAATLVNYDLAVFKNTSISGALSFSDQTNFIPGTFYGQHIVALGDIDGDGKNDAVTTTSYTEGLVSVHLNTFSSSPSIQSFAPLAGKAGDTIIITGTNFNSIAAVSFGNIPAASFIVESSTTIKAVVGLGSSGNVSVTTASGSISLPGFIYLASVFSFTPSTGTAGTVVTITGDGFTGTTGVSFGGASATSFTVVSSTSITAVIGTGATGKIAVIDSAGTALSANDFIFIPSQAPVINSVTPNAADRGSTITITGSNFSSNANENNVYFGTIKAVVVSSTSNTLTVIVPNGAVYEHIIVTTSNLTAISPKPFVTTFAGSRNFTTTSFAGRAKVAAGNTNSFLGDLRFDDLNGDNKLDIIVPTYNGFNVLQNTNTNNGQLSFAPLQLFVTPSSYDFFGDNFAISDIDGDGKPDIIEMDMLSQVGIRRNISTASVINFDTVVTIPARPIALGSSWHCISVGDINQDGKPDIAVVNGNSGYISVFINNSVGGSIRFDEPIDIYIAPTPIKIKIEDIDNDQKPDLIITAIIVNGGDSTTIYVVKNTSSGGVASFDPVLVFPAGAVTHLEIGDLDGDNKPDIVVSDFQGFSILHNTSTAGTISFSSRIPFKLPYSNGFNVMLNDLNGDGKPDIFTSEIDIDSITVFENLSTPGNIDFSNKYSYASGRLSDEIYSGDLDGDGKPDIAVVQHGSDDNITQDPLSIFRNQSGTTIEQVCSGGNKTLHSTVTGTSYQWQQNTGNGFNNIADNNIVTGTNTSTLQLSNVPVSYSGYQYLCIADGIKGDITTLSVDPGITAAVNISTPSINVCTGASVTFVASPSNGGASPSYQWQVNNTNTGTNNSTFTTSSLINGSVVKVIMTGSDTSACGVAPVVNSNAITITVNAVVPTVTISGTTLVKKDSAVIISSVITNGGTLPKYQWQDSTNTHGWQNIAGAVNSTILYTAASTGDKIRCILTSNADCASVNSVNSNTLLFTVNPVTAIGVVPGRTNGLRYYPNPVTTTLTIDSLQLNEHWQTLDIITTNGKNNILSFNIRNQSKLSISLQSLSPGFYVAVLRRKQGAPAYLKFIKM